jgi:hypothetical protein
VLTLAAPAMAQTDKRPSEGVFSFKLGSYLPGVDEAPGLTAKPYELAFGDETMLLLEGQLEKPLYQGVGLLSVAFNLGYMSVDGKARTQSGAASTDTTDLTIMPVRAGLLYRFDFFSKGYDIPLVPTIGAGLDWHLWWSNNTKDEIASAGDGEAIGGVWGWHGSVGLALLLDWFDTSSATSMLLDFDIINSYLFAEFTTNRIDGFGAEDSLRLSDDAWLFGLSFEY